MVNPNLKTDPSTIYNLLKSYALSPSTILKAHHLFQQIHRPTLSFWNLMIRGWSISDQPIEAIRLYNLMYGQGLLGNNLTYPFLFKACARVPHCKKFREVLGVFEAMRVADVKGDAVTMVKVVLACSFLSEWSVADAMVDYIEENKVEMDVYLGNTLIDMYGRRGLVHLAHGVFDRMERRNLVSWNTMIMGYGKAINHGTCRGLFEMQNRIVFVFSNDALELESKSTASLSEDEYSSEMIGESSVALDFCCWVFCCED
ncbi:Pentatricopeptide repeat-containing protein [Vigna angularis]|uniref:Pentatricopeptide repeat-containing protein n=1 Tax=Phaseolus angularis TaxID=3914 RepID=A0A8T0KXA3_PHAAN|nr:Pentatricopeptide repeat-containing protein [Vigna angularis]